MATRVVSGTVYHPGGSTPWASATVKFRLASRFATASLSYPAEQYTATTDGTGAFSIALAVPDTGTALYECTLPDGMAFQFALAAGAATTLEALINAASSVSVPQNTVQAAIDAHAAANDAHSLLRLTDTPNSYVGQGTKVVVVKADELGVEFAVPASAPLNAPYVTTASDASLSAEVVIPSLGASADIKGAAGAGTAREFAAGDTAPTFTVAPAASDVGVTVPSHLYFQTTDATERFATYAWAPAGAFDVRAKLTFVCQGTLTAQDFGLIVANSDRTSYAYVMFQTSASGANALVKGYTFASSTFTQRGNSQNCIMSTFVYVRLTRDASNNVSFYYSLNGIAWQLIALNIAFTFTVALLGVKCGTAGGTDNRHYIDWIRTDV